MSLRLKQAWRRGFAIGFIAGFAVMILALLYDMAWGQEAHTHEGEVGKFYMSWRIPPSRTTSCCNDKDCFATEFRKQGNQWFALDKDGAWLLVPPEKIEQNQGDPRDSPDGRGHICANYHYVFCAVLGGGT